MADNLEMIEDSIARLNSKFSRSELIDHYELEIRYAEIKIESFKLILDFLKQKPAFNLKWRDEIRNCVDNREYLLSSNAIIECVCTRHGIDPDKNIKLKIPTTLSKMYEEGKVGRLMIDGEYKYGRGDLFDKDANGKLTIKK